MSDDRRALLRRALLKEHIASEQAAPSNIQTTDNSPPPTPQSYPVEQSTDDNSFDPQAALAGAAQGSTFGFSDELGGAKDAAGDLIQGKAGLSDLATKYREYQKAREAANTELQNKSPWSYGAGEVGGGLATALVTPTFGAAKLAGTAAELAPELAPAAAKFLSGGAESLAGRFAGKGAASVLEGAPIGGLYGAGTSKGDLAHPAELAADIGSGMEMGSLTGLGLHATGAAAKMGLNAAESTMENSKFLRQMKKAYDYGKQGIDIGSSKTQDELSLLPNQMSSELVDKIKGVDKQIGQKVGDALQTAQDSGVKINIDPKINEVGQRLFKNLFVDNPSLGDTLDPKTKALLQKIAQQGTGDLTPIEARAIKDNLYTMADNLAGFNSDAANFAKQQGNSLARELDTSLKSSIPDYAQAARQFEEFRRLVPETIMSKATPSQYGKTYMGDLKNPDLKLFESSRDVLGGSQLPGMNAERDRQTLQQLHQNLKTLQQSNPEAVQGLGGNADEVMDKIRGQADELAMLHQAQGREPHSSMGKVATGQIFGLAASGTGQALGIANKVGRSVDAAGQSGVVKLATSAFQAGDDQLRNVASKLKADKATSNLGDVLENALNNKSEVTKNAVLFKLMQDPNYRNLLKEQGIGGDTNEQ